MSDDASPQLEKGHTRIANELLEAIVKYPFCATELKIALFIIRNTYGWNKKEAIISYGMVANGVDIDIRYAKRIIGNLIKNRIIFREKIDNQNVFGLNKNYKSWRLWITNDVGVKKDTSTVSS